MGRVVQSGCLHSVIMAILMVSWLFFGYGRCDSGGDKMFDGDLGDEIKCPLLF